MEFAIVATVPVGSKCCSHVGNVGVICIVRLTLTTLKHVCTDDQDRMHLGMLGFLRQICRDMPHWLAVRTHTYAQWLGIPDQATGQLNACLPR